MSLLMELSCDLRGSTNTGTAGMVS